METFEIQKFMSKNKNFIDQQKYFNTLSHNHD